MTNHGFIYPKLITRADGQTFILCTIGGEVHDLAEGSERYNQVIWYAEQGQLEIADGGTLPPEPREVSRAETLDEIRKSLEQTDAAVRFLLEAAEPEPEPHNFPSDMSDRLIDWDHPPAEVLAEAFPDEDFADLKARLLVELGSLRNMLVGNIPMSAEEQAQKLARLAVLEHPKFQTWFQG